MDADRAWKLLTEAIIGLLVLLVSVSVLIGWLVAKCTS